MKNTRRDFLQTLLAMGGAAATLGALGCGDDDGATDSDLGVDDEDAGSGLDAGPGSDAGGGDEDAGSGGSDAGSGGDDAGSASSCGSVDGSIGTNHGHTITVPVADVEAGTETIYDIQGTSGHPHSVTVTAADFATLASGGTVTLVSTGGGRGNHTHDVILMCADA